MSKEVRTSAPEPLPQISFEIPQPKRTQLENGLRVVVFEESRLPLASFRLVFLSGDADDPSDHIGVTSAVAAMLTEGTKTLSSKEFAEKVESLGASVSASSSDDFTVVAASSLSLYANETLDLLAEIVLRPSFSAEELDLYKRNTIENLKFQRSQPGFLANEQTARILYGEHPYANLSPKPSDVEKLDRATLAEAHSSKFIPNNAVFIAVGDVKFDSLIERLNSRFRGWQVGQVEEKLRPELPTRSGRTLTIVDRKGSAQANIVLANLALKRNDPDYFAVVVMNQILGAGASSRCFMNLREEKGYTYGAYTRLDMKRSAGDFEATAEVRTAVTGDSLKEFFYELERIRNEQVLEEELTDAQNFLTGVFPIRAETQEGLTGLIVNQQLYGLPDDYLQTYRSMIDAVTAEDVQRVANKYIHPDALAIVIVGDAREIIPQVSQYSDNVEIYDIHGAPATLEDEDPADDGEAADVSGEWELALDFQGQNVKVQMTLAQARQCGQGTDRDDIRYGHDHKCQSDRQQIFRCRRN